MRRLCLLAWLAIPLASLGFLSTPARALEECRLLRQPDIRGDVIVFVYAGDLWKVSRSGGVATRLTSHEGQETFPKISPDGKTVAFTGEYDGNTDVYTVPMEGGEPTRITWHPAPDQMAAWFPDGKSLLIRSQRNTASTVPARFYKVSAAGGFEEPLAPMTSGYCSLSPDGRQLAYVYPAYDGRTWKRYRGGNAPDIWVYDLEKNTSYQMTDWAGSDEWPMWYQGTVYYASDQGGFRANLWAYDTQTKARRQVTRYADDDIKWPSIGGNSIVFEKGGNLNVMELPSEKVTQIKVLVPDDKPGARPEYRNVAQWTGGWDLSPSAKRVVIEARGEIFTVPAEKGDVRNLTHSPGSRERDPAWSPDGKSIAYFSDRTGEYEIWISPSDGKGSERQLTHGLGVYPYTLAWSPDSKKLAYNDKSRTLKWADAAQGTIHVVDRSDHEDLNEFRWSPDSRWLTYAKNEANNLRRVYLYSLESQKATPVTDGMSDDFSPSVDPDGKYLYFLSRRNFRPSLGSEELNFQFNRTDGIYAVTLRDSLGSPLPPQDDEESGDSGDKGKGDDKSKSDDKAGAKPGAAGARPGSAGGGAARPEAPKPVPAMHVDLAGISARATSIPVAPGNYSALTAVKGKLIFVDNGDPDADGPHAELHDFDLDKRENKTILTGVSPAYALSKDGSRILYKSGDRMGITDVGENKKVGDGKIDAGTLMALVDPRQEWLQMFNEAWRLERDFYYDPKMGGLDWKAVGDHYRALIPYVAHRSDLNYILGELIGELSTSHTYVGGGDFPNVPRVATGLLGADYELDAASGLYRFKKIYRERDWNSKVAPPLGEPGIQVKEGDYLLAVNGQPVKAPMNVYAAFVGTAEQVTRITVGSAPADPSPRNYLVKPITQESSLRYTDWVNTNRRKVDQATGGKVGYIHVPNTAQQGIIEFGKQFYPQVDKQGLIVDERFNGGGFIPTFFVERLARKTASYATGREGDFRNPDASIDGPKCILVNHFAGSGGDYFPYYFRQAGVGPVIGTRTWGGLVGISHGLPLVDGGSVTMPEFGIYTLHSEWMAENHGVDPDILVENTPDSWAAGHDLQLERAIQWTLDEMKKNPPTRAAHPAFRVQAEAQ